MQSINETCFSKEWVDGTHHIPEIIQKGKISHQERHINEILQ